MSEVTQILRDIRDDKAHSAEQLLSLVYTELKRIAAQKMARCEDGKGPPFAPWVDD